MNWSIVTTSLQQESDLVSVRQRAKRISELLGFETQEQIRLATAVSEIARNALSHGGGSGSAEFLLAAKPLSTLLIRIRDRGKGIDELEAVLDGRTPRLASPRDGHGIRSARKLVDHFQIQSGPTGTFVELGKSLPANATAVSAARAVAIANQLLRDRSADPLVAWREQSLELLDSLNEARDRQEELARLNRELEDTNRGVVALYAELDERAEQLRRASELKSRFLSNVSHELRTPLNSILALSRLLLDRADGDLTQEQEKQASYIQSSASNLIEMVNDLLDIAKVEAGRIEVKSDPFTITDLFAGLRGSLKPLSAHDPVELIFEADDDLPVLWTDETKLAQILRNFISNSLKFTERGEVRVRASFEASRGNVVFMVRDSGIGIAAEDQDRIFEEFVQIESRMQRRGKGTGLGLPLSRKLAELLGGTIEVASTLGDGSTFTLTIPADYEAECALSGHAEPLQQTKRVLIVDDDEGSRYVLRQLLAAESRLVIEEANDGAEGLARIAACKPDVVLLDLQMPVLDGFAVLATLAGDSTTRDLPVIVFTSLPIDAALRERLAHASVIMPKEALTKQCVLAVVHRALRRRDAAHG